MSLPLIRSAVLADLPAMISLYRHLNPDDPAPDMKAAEAAWARLLASAEASVLVAEVDGVLAASCTLVIVPNVTRAVKPYALIENVVTHADYRRSGLGGRLMHEALREAWAADCYKVMLATGSTEEATLRFYENSGFVRGGKTFFQAWPPKEKGRP